jgi:quercetin dioxygenase-like cupin family protein
MKITKINAITNDPAKAPPGLSGIMTGKVSILELTPGSKDFIINLIHFEKGVRNKLHTHSCDQVLIVTDGKGVVATEQEKKIVTSGDVILFPAEEKHWHGATDDSDFSHIFILTPKSITKQIKG